MDIDVSEESRKDNFLVFVLIAAGVSFILLLTFALILVWRCTREKTHSSNTAERNTGAVDNFGKQLRLVMIMLSLDNKADK